MSVKISKTYKIVITLCFFTLTLMLMFQTIINLFARNQRITSPVYKLDESSGPNVDSTGPSFIFRSMQEVLCSEKRRGHPLKFLDDNDTDIVSPNSALLVDTSNCKIIRWPAFDAKVIPLYSNHSNHAMYCKKSIPNHNITIERTDFNAIKIGNPLNKFIDCSAQRVERKDDFNIRLSPPITLNTGNNSYFAKDIAVKVNCTIAEDNDRLIKVLPLVPEPEYRQTDEELPNVLMLGIDSVSRLNFDRHFVRTARVLSDHRFYTMYGYNKVGDNTFPNLTPLLTGFYPEDIWVDKLKVPFNYFPFVWKGYHDKGYQTYYFEDAPLMNTFNYMKRGFKELPTDYYLRTFCMAMDKEVKGNCYLDQPAPQVYLDYLVDFIRAMKARNQKYFTFHFMAKLTHDYLNNAGLMDPFIQRFFDKLFGEKLLDNTIVIFFSDHGIRFGKIRETLSGKYEERLPFMHIHVPKEWRNRNLTVNQHRLSTPFDIHATLKHILYGVKDNGKYGKTLFEEIPEERSCQSIPISDHWCGCQTSRVITDLKSMKPFSEFVVQQTNQLLSPLSAKCAQLSLQDIQSATEQTLSDKVLRFQKCKTDSDLCLYSGVFGNTSQVVSTTKHYMITVRVKPSDALLEATVSHDTASGNMTILGDISRINLYGNQSHCVDSAFLKKYCFCKDFIESNNLSQNNQ